MKKIIISIKPEYAEKIVNGSKKFEYRTKRPKENIDYILIYCTFPKMRVIAKVKVKKIIQYTPKAMWNKTGSHGGINRKEFFKYFNNRKLAFAFELGEIIEYKNPKKITKYGHKHPPQSFIYLN